MAKDPKLCRRPPDGDSVYAHAGGVYPLARFADLLVERSLVDRLVLPLSKRAGGKQAAEAGHHRAQRARIGGNAHAHLQARGAHRGRELSDAVESAS